MFERLETKFRALEWMNEGLEIKGEALEPKMFIIGANYLLSLEVDRFLHNTHLSCGLEPKGALYGGWRRGASPGIRWGII